MQLQVASRITEILGSCKTFLSFGAEGSLQQVQAGDLSVPPADQLERRAARPFDLLPLGFLGIFRSLIAFDRMQIGAGLPFPPRRDNRAQPTLARPSPWTSSLGVVHRPWGAQHDRTISISG